MSFVQNFPFFTIILSLVCAVSSFVLKKNIAKWISAALLSVSSVLNLAVVLYCANGNITFTYMMGHFPAPWGNELTAGIFESLMALVFAFVMLMSILGGADHVEHDVPERRRHLYWVMVDLTHAALMALCYTNDIFTGYVFIEVCTIASCALLAVRNGGRVLIASVRYMIFALVGSGLFLMGVVFTYSITGHLLFPQLQEAIALLWRDGSYRLSMTVAIGLMTAGLSIKAGLFPFHFWLPSAHGRATVATSGILSGVIVKGYLFLLIKIIYRVVGVDIFHASGIQYVLLLFGVAAMVFCSAAAVGSRRLKTMVAYSSAAQIGYMFMGLGMGTEAALVAVFFQIIAHAVTKPMLFLASSALMDACGGHQDFHSLRGAAHRNKAAGVLFTVGALSMVGIPMFIGFIPKLHFASAAFGMDWRTWAVLGALVISTLLNVLYFLYTAMLLWLPVNDANRPSFNGRKAWLHALPALVLAAVNVVLGIHSAPLTALLEQGIALFCR